MRLKPYPEYRDSGLPWLGEIPAHWEFKRIKHVFEEVNWRERYGDEVLLSLTRSRGLIPHSEASEKLPSAEDWNKYKVYKPGELVMNRMQAWSGMFGVAEIGGLVSPDYSVFKATSGDDVNFFKTLFMTPLYTEQFAQRSQGIGSGFNRLYTPDFMAIPVASPSPEEQRGIAYFLDSYDRVISRLITAKQRLIKLLSEQKQAIIHRAVTRGLDSDVPMKPTGLDWLPEVPEHWEMRRLKAISRFITSGSRGWANFYSDKGPVFLRIGNLSTRSIELKLDDLQHVSPPEGAEGERTRVRPDDLLISITALLGAVGIVPSSIRDAYVNQHTALDACCVDWE